jgi:hypothetical protein
MYNTIPLVYVTLLLFYPCLRFGYDNYCRYMQRWMKMMPYYKSLVSFNRFYL